MKYEDKLKQCNKECMAAIVGLALTIAVWLLCGFGLAGVNVVVFSTPLWIVAGLGGTFLFAFGFSIFFAKFVMHDISLEEEETEVAE